MQISQLSGPICSYKHYPSMPHETPLNLYSSTCALFLQMRGATLFRVLEKTVLIFSILTWNTYRAHRTFVIALIFLAICSGWKNSLATLCRLGLLFPSSLFLWVPAHIGVQGNIEADEKELDLEVLYMQQVTAKSEAGKQRRGLFFITADDRSHHHFLSWFHALICEPLRLTEDC